MLGAAFESRLLSFCLVTGIHQGQLSLVFGVLFPVGLLWQCLKEVLVAGGLWLCRTD